MIDRGTVALTAWNIHTKQKLNQHLPSPESFYCTIIEDKVLIGPWCKTEQFPVYVWDLYLNRIEEIGNFSNLILCHLDVARSVLVAFRVNFAIHPPEVQ